MKPSALLALGVLIYSVATAGAAPSPTPASADETQGIVIPFKRVSVSAPVLQDNIKDIEVEEGDSVKQGDILAHLLNDREQLEVDRCKNLINRTQFEYDGMKKLADEKLATKDSELEKETELEAAKVQYKMAQVTLDEKTIKSPLSGIVVKRYKEPGESVDRTEKLFDIVNIDQVYIQFYLQPAQIQKLSVKQKVPTRFPAVDASREYQATVSFIDPSVDAASGLYRVKLLLDNPNHDIKAGMRASADFTRASSAP